MEISLNGSKLLTRFGLLIALVILAAVLSITSDQFLSINNILNLLLQASVNASLAAGMTLVILTAGIDLSVGSVLALTAVVTASMLQSELPVILAVVIGFATGAFIGTINGLLVHIAKIPPFIATLGMMTLTRGLALSYSQGRPVTGLPEDFLKLGVSFFLGIPTPVIIIFALYLFGTLILYGTSFGRYIYAIGTNVTAAKYAGIPIGPIIITVYAVSGVLAAFGGMVLVARLDSAQPVMGITYELDAIAAVVLGGASLAGGRGTLGGTFLGVLIMAVIANAINILNISPFYAQVLKGSIIIVALLIYSLGQKDRS